MGVYIKDIKMPKNCEECDFATVGDIDFEYNLFCKCSKKYCDLDAFGHPIGWNCPLIEVPDNHGDLIERPKKLEYGGLVYIAPNDFVGIARYFAKQIDNAPTIIGAEGSEE